MRSKWPSTLGVGCQPESPPAFWPGVDALDADRLERLPQLLVAEGGQERLARGCDQRDRVGGEPHRRRLDRVSRTGAGVGVLPHRALPGELAGQLVGVAEHRLGQQPRHVDRVLPRRRPVLGHRAAPHRGPHPGAVTQRARACFVVVLDEVHVRWLRDVLGLGGHRFDGGERIGRGDPGLGLRDRRGDVGLRLSLGHAAGPPVALGAGQGRYWARQAHGAPCDGDPHAGACAPSRGTRGHHVQYGFPGTGMPDGSAITARDQRVVDPTRTVPPTRRPDPAGSACPG